MSQNMKALKWQLMQSKRFITLGDYINVPLCGKWRGLILNLDPAASQNHFNHWRLSVCKARSLLSSRPSVDVCLSQKQSAKQQSQNAPWLHIIFSRRLKRISCRLHMSFFVLHVKSIALCLSSTYIKCWNLHDGARRTCHLHITTNTIVYSFNCSVNNSRIYLNTYNNKTRNMPKTVKFIKMQLDTKA